MFLHLLACFLLIVNSDLLATFLVGDSVDLPLPGIENNFLMSTGFSLFAVVELTNNVDSLLSGVSLVMTSSFPDSLLLTINSFND